MSLVCKKCGYEQSDNDTILASKIKFPGYAEHDIPYYCGACLDNATDEEYENMMTETEGNKNASVIIINTYRGLVDSIFTNIELPENATVIVQDTEEDEPLYPTDDLKQL